MDIGAAIKMIREAHDETLRDMADVLGISHPHLSNLENGKALPSLKLLAAFRRYYSLDPYILAALNDWKVNVTMHVEWNNARQKEKV